MHTLKSIVTLLHKHHQRATYKAVAAVLGETARSVMQGSPRTWTFSWVVNQDTGRPGAYPEGMIHPDLEEHESILRSGDELLAWLAKVGP